MFIVYAVNTFLMEERIDFMELLKKRKKIGGLSCHDKATAYSEGDVIVPDTKPDILKILQVDAVSAITSKTPSDGGVRIEGNVNYNILYIPETEAGGLKSITAQQSFSCMTAGAELSENAISDVRCEVERVEFDMINSRKLSLRAAVLIEYKIWENKEVTLCVGVDDEGAEAIYQTISPNSPELFAEHCFVVRDRLEIPTGRAPIGEILKMDIDVGEEEIKAITGRAVVKGSVSISALYSDSEGKINSLRGEIPFTELAEMAELEEDAECSVEYRVCDCGFEAGGDDDGDMRYINFDISLAAAVHSSKKEEVRIVKDCFCPGSHTDTLYEECELFEAVSTAKHRYTVKEAAAPDKKLPQISSIYNVVARPSIISATPKKGRVLLEGKLELYILYITDNAQLPIYSIKKEVPTELSIDAEECCEGLLCEAELKAENVSFNLNMAQEAEIRCILSAEARLCRKTKINMISDCVPTEEEKDCEIVIYFVQPGDTLWDIAKGYAVSVADIAKYNGLSEERALVPGERLVIPFC